MTQDEYIYMGTVDDSQRFGMGWIPDLPDFRDYTVKYDKVSQRLRALGQKDSINTMLKKVGILEPVGEGTLPTSVDLRQWCSPIENQGSINSCTANAGVGLVEYYERRAFGRHIDASRLFLYKTTRNMLKWTGDYGANLRTTMGAMTLFGVPPEEYWPYNTANVNVEPTSFCYAFADNYKAIQYLRLDPPGTSKDVLLDTVKTDLVAGLPSMFGLTLYNSFYQAQTGGKIPLPCQTDYVIGGHGLITVGYDNNIVITNTNCGSDTTGALLIRNSYGKGWGDSGYGWLPYNYITNGLAVDWWTLLKNEWVDTGQFKF